MAKNNHRMSHNDQVSAQEAIACCRKLSGFLQPMLLDALGSGDKSSADFIGGVVADLGALRAALDDMLAESRAADSRTSVNGNGYNGRKKPI